MEYNPFAQEFNRLRGSIERKKGDKSTLVRDLKWFDSTDIGSLLFSLEEKETSKSNLKSLIEGIEKNINLLNRDIQETGKCIKTFFNPFNWFDDSQKNYRNKLDELKSELRRKQEYKTERLQSLSAIDITINKIRSDIARYKQFNKQKAIDEVNELDCEITLLTEEFSRVSDLKNKVDTTLLPVIEQIKRYEFNISDAEGRISKAKSFERELNYADNSYERAMIHEKCEKTLGEGSQKKIIRQQEGLIRKHERDLDKARKRATQISKNASRDIKKIVIDGNNMCYEGNKFVGLAPLIASTAELQKQFEVIVVFDSAIRAQLRTDDQSIKERFNNGIKVHVVASKRLADETILDVASEDDLCYVLSNDRFAEFTEKEVVRNRRIIRHEIVDENVIIHDLNVNVLYG